MTLNFIKNSFAATMLFTTMAANAALVDLSTWQHDGQGNWAVQGANQDSVYQSINGQPTVYFEAGTNARNTAISGQITVKTSGDDDFIGFVLGYSDNELQSNTADYWLIDWKQGNQGSGGSTALAGLSLSHVTNGQTENNFWGHYGGVTEIARAATLGSTGWGDFVNYTFDIIHTASLIQVSVNGNVELNISAADAGVTEFTDGAYGFYNYSQSNVEYAGITERAVSNSVPEPSTLAILALGLIGFSARQRKNKK